MIVSFSDLNYFNFHFSWLQAMDQPWSDNASFTMSHPRPTDALLFFCGCSGTLTYPDARPELQIPQGSACLIPHGEKYTWLFHKPQGGNDVSCMLFEFLLVGDSGENLEFEKGVRIIDSTHAGLYTQLFSDLIRENSRPQISYPRLYSAAYSLLAVISEAVRAKSATEQNFECIYNGIKYLEDDPVQELSIRQIAELCNVSVNYFERLFREYSGLSPTKYRLLRRTDRAKAMLSNSILSVEQIAEALHYSDCAHFCRSFKSFCGVTPTEYRRISGKNPAEKEL